MNIVTGAPATGSNFFPRTDIVEYCWDRLPHDNILLAAPRRTGKTSLMLHLRDKPRHGYQGLFVNVEGKKSAAGMIHAMLDQYLCTNRKERLVRRLTDRLNKLFPELHIKIQAGPVLLELDTSTLQDQWQEIGESFLTLLRDLPESENVLFLVDEFPILVQRLRSQDDHGATEAEQLLHWFRAVRTDPDLSAGKVRFFLSGSIGLEGVVSRMGLSKTINDLTTLTLPPLTSTEASQLLDALVGGPSGITIPQAAREALLGLLDEPYPYFIQLFFDHVRQRVIQTHNQCTPDLIRDVYQHDLLGPGGQKALRHMNERLDEALTRDEARLARTVLDRACQSNEGIQLQTAYNLLTRDDQEGTSDTAHALLEVLLHDGYLRRDGNRLRFRTRLLRDFWKNARPLVERTGK